MIDRVAALIINYKFHKTMTTSNSHIAPKISEPAILSANAFYWTPGASASQRRKTEEKKIKEVSFYLEYLGFIITESDCNSMTAINGNVEVRFYYHESCQNVYKSLAVFKNGKKSNITTIRKIAATI